MTSGGTDWRGFYDAIAGRPVRPLLVEALAAAGEAGEGRTAVDLGFGDGTESRALLERGWRVYAVDATPAAKERLEASISPADAERLVAETADFADVDVPPCDLLFAGLSIPFCAPSAFDALWMRITDALRPTAVLACHLFGVRDSWASNPEMSFVDADRVRGLLEPFEVISLREQENDGQSYSGPKHWHIFEIVARRT